MLPRSAGLAKMVEGHAEDLVSDEVPDSATTTPTLTPDSAKHCGEPQPRRFNPVTVSGRETGVR
jgi:hypothetical protein